jgi:hypothetical protein
MTDKVQGHTQKLAGYLNRMAEHRGDITSVDASALKSGAGAIDTILSQRDALRQALEDLLTYDRVMRPAFRSKPLGAPNSQVRIDEDKLIACEDAALAALSLAERVK